jgi:prepilin signal peptidase PulO-like enzyme (type II secretory pathway)
MVLLYYFGKLFSKLIARSRGETFNEDELGFGDVILGGVLGLILGWPGIVLGIILALLIGGLVSLVFIVIMLVRRNYRSFVAIPYGPFLIAGAVALLYFKELINSFIGQ